MAHRLVKNVLSDFGGRAVHVVSSAVLLLFLTRTLGPDSYGLLTLSLSIFAFTRIVSESGIPWAAARYIAQYRETEPKVAVAAVVESWLLVLFASITVMTGLFFGADLVAAVFDQPRLAAPLTVGATYVLFFTLHRYNRAILQGYEAISAQAKLHGIEGILAGVAVVAFVLYSPTPTAAVAGYVLAYAVSAVVGLWTVSTVSGVGRSTLTTSGEVRSKILRYNVPLSVTRVASDVGNHLDVILVGVLANPTQVAFYALGKQISQLTRVPAASIGFALSPTYGSESAQGRTETATRIYEESLTKTLILYVPACVGILVIADPAIPLLFGPEYAGGVLVVQILAVVVLFEAFELITGPALDYLGRARSRAIANATTASANAVLNVALIPRYGAAGAAVATVVTFGAYVAITGYIVRTELPFNVRAVARSAGAVLLISAGMAIAILPLLHLLSGFLALGVAVGVGVAIWFVSCHAFDLLDVDRLVGQLLG